MVEDPLIAVAGSIDPLRKESLGLVSPEAALKAAEELGRELAKSHCRIVVYSSDPAFVEPTVVKGYVEGNEARPGSIQVRYPSDLPQPSFQQQKDHPECFDFRPDKNSDWEVSFYHSLYEVDGVVLIGGGLSTYIGGIVAMGLKLPVIALQGFGGSARKVWQSLSPAPDGATQEEINLMGQQNWSPDSARRCVESLLNQRTRRDEQKTKERLAELQRSHATRWYAVLAALLFMLSVAAVPLTWDNSSLGRLLLGVLFVSPLMAGVSGATIRMIFDLSQGKAAQILASSWTTAALGSIAGGVAALLFLVAQMTAIPEGIAPDLQARQTSRLVPFAVVIGFIAGFTLDAVFRKLREVDITRTEGLAKSLSH